MWIKTHICLVRLKVRKEAEIRKRYNQVPHLTQDTTGESNKIQKHITNKSQEVSPFPAGDHKAAMNRRKTMRNTRHKNTFDPQKSTPFERSVKYILLEGFKWFQGTNLTFSSNPYLINALSPKHINQDMKKEDKAKIWTQQYIKLEQRNPTGKPWCP